MKSGAPRAIWRDLLIVLGVALGLRLIFAALTADSYDPDEFVVLALSRDFAHGAVPYRDFAFFHPPGILVLFRLLQPIIAGWWPAGRLVTLAIDSLTAVIVWRTGLLLFGRRSLGLAAGLVYAASPIALLDSVRVGQDSIITFLGMAGLLCLLSAPGGRELGRRGQLSGQGGAILAGICLGLAIWFKYPAILFLPVYALAAPRRVLTVVLAAVATVAAVFAPFLPEIHPLLRESVGWQALQRSYAGPLQKVVALTAFWLALNPLAVVGLLRWRGPRWVQAGFFTGAFFLLTAQIYYHYFAPVVPFAALLGAPLAVELVRRGAGMRLAAAGLALFAAWVAALNIGPTRAGLAALQFSATDITVQVLDRVTGPKERVLADQFEYAYLANRGTTSGYFWDMQGVVNARSLEMRLRNTKAVVATGNPVTSYPAGFLHYLAHCGYSQVHTPGATVWLRGSASC